MNQNWLLIFGGAFTLLVVIVAFVLLRLVQRQQRLAERVNLSRGVIAVPSGTRQEALKGAWARVIAAFGHVILGTGLLSARSRADLELTLISVGLRNRNGLEIFVGSKGGLMICLPLLTMLALRGIQLPLLVSWATPFAAGVAGLLLPDYVVRYRRKRYLRRVEGGLPDALDLMVICSQAGLGLTAAIVRVAEEMQRAKREIGLEFAIAASELQLMDTRLALLNMGVRTGIDGLTRLSTTLVQSMQYGTPLTDAMRVLSAEMRQDTLTRFEAKAARLGVLLTVPMILFMLPCVFLIVGGPAIVQVLRITR